MSFQEGLPTTPGPLGGTPYHFRPSGRAFRPLPALRDGFPTTPALREGLPTTLGSLGEPPVPQGGPTDHF